ncbi:MAG: magnesium transporter [Halanaerobiales bacterium]
MVLKWMGFDPALGSSIFLTTFLDIVGFFVFLSLARIFINLLL